MLLLKNALHSVGQAVLSAAILFAFYRFLLQQIGPAEIGVWSIVVAGTAAARLADFGMSGGVIRFVALDIGAGDVERAARTIGMNVLIIGVVLAVVCVAIYPAFLWVLPRFVKDPELLDLARELVPWALVSLWFGVLSQIFLGSLDACLRSDLRVQVVIGSALVQLLAGYWLVPIGGLAALGPVQLIQSGFALTFSFVALVWILRAPRAAWMRWDHDRFRELLRFGGGIQASAFGQLLFEPTVKGLLAMFSGLQATGYYEVANRAITQARAVIVSAYQTLTPYLAQRLGSGAMDTAELRRASSLAHTLLISLALPSFALLIAATPAILSLWIGRWDSNFVLTGLICAAGWGANTLVTAAHMTLLAIGKVRWLALTQLAIGVLNLSLAGLAGALTHDGIIMIAASMLALALGSLVTLQGVNMELDMSWRQTLPTGMAPLALVCASGATVLVAWQFQERSPGLPSAGPAAGLLLLAVACLALLARQPAVRMLLSRLRSTAARR